ncbi:MAG: CaiB/BaiF CoA-transferase family protein, partial [Alphaproteobacteria bacterium]
CSISGYGHATPFRLVAGYDPIAQAETGMMYLTGAADIEPQKAGGSIGDTFTGLHAGMAALAALEARRRTGRGQHVEVSLFDSMLHALGYVAEHALLTGEDPPRMGNKSFALVPLGVFLCADGPIMIVVGNDRQFAKFCREVLERPDLLDDPRYGSIASRLANREPLEAEIEAAFLRRPRAEWVDRMRKAGVPGGAVRSPLEAVRSPEATARGMISTVRHDGETVEVVGSPFRFSETPVARPGEVPARGAHTDAILADVLGYDAAEIGELRAAGAFGGAN